MRYKTSYSSFSCLVQLYNVRKATSGVFPCYGRLLEGITAGSSRSREGVNMFLFFCFTSPLHVNKLLRSILAGSHSVRLQSQHNQNQDLVRIQASSQFTRKRRKSNNLTLRVLPTHRCRYVHFQQVNTIIVQFTLHTYCTRYLWTYGEQLSCMFLFVGGGCGECTVTIWLQ